MVASAATRNEQWALSRLRVASIWAPNCPQWGPHTGRGARTGGLVDDRTRSTIGPAATPRRNKGARPSTFAPTFRHPADMTTASRRHQLFSRHHRQVVFIDNVCGFITLATLSPTPFTGHDLCDKG